MTTSPTSGGGTAMVTLVVTTREGALDLYSYELSQKIDAHLLYLKHSRSFGTPLFSLTTFNSIIDDSRSIRMLGSQGILHLPHQHLGRYINFLKTPCIITVHDLIRQFDRLGYSPLIQKPNLRDRTYLALDWRGIKKAKQIIAISQTTKRDLVYYMGIPEGRITVIYHGIDHDIFKPRTELKPFDGPYILFVGSEQPRKNLAVLLEAFHRLKAEHRFKDLKLIKAGNPGGLGGIFRDRTLNTIRNLRLEGEVLFTGFLADEELPSYYSNAACLVLPSLYEGFGVPVLEAMACGCPVIVSNTSSLPEIVGDAAITVDPLDVEGLADTIRRVLTNPELRNDLIKQGLERASNFSWEKTAEETSRVYEEVEQQWGKG